MSVSRLMTYGVYALGALMVILGLYFVSAGVPIARLEIGWAEIISGSVAASAGCIVVVLGLLMSNLESMQATLDRLATGESRPAFEDTLPFRPTLSEPFDTDAPAVQPAAPPAPAHPPELRPVHPLAPAARWEPAPASIAAVRPEPGLTAALHPAEDDETVDAPPTAMSDAPAPHEPALDEGAPALLQAEDEDIAQSPPVFAPDPVADPIADAPPSRLRSKFLTQMLARRPQVSTVRPKAPQPAPPRDEPVVAPILPTEAAPRSVVDLSSGWDDEPVAPPQHPADVEEAAKDHPTVDRHPEDKPPAHDDILNLDAPIEPSHAEPVAVEPATEAPAPVPPPVNDPLSPVVVGRYNAGTASYVMYSNGMIEVETEHGTHQFASMQDLKAFIERRDARAS